MEYIIFRCDRCGAEEEYTYYPYDKHPIWWRSYTYNIGPTVYRKILCKKCASFYEEEVEDFNSEFFNT